jgi:hypothetical protein
MDKMNNEIRLVSGQADKSESQCETSGLEELIADLLVNQWIEEQNKKKDNKINANEKF